MNEYMKNKKSLFFVSLFAMVLTLLGGTLAVWVWESLEDQRSNVAFSVESYDGGYSCSADGGGEITSNEAFIMPAPCTSSDNVIMREITTNVEIGIDGVSVLMDLWLDVNEIGTPLSESDNFRYVVTTSSASCNSGVVSSGSFNGKTAGDQVNILSREFGATSTKKYYLYIWLDSAETNVETANQNFSLSLNGSCEGSLGVDKPALDEGMIPVVISDTGTVKTIASDDSSWYDYSNQKWANMVLVNGTSRSKYLGTKNVVVNQSDILGYYVWIPRYKYKIWTTGVSSTGNEQTIDIKFENKSDPIQLGTQVGEYRTHPAFWFDYNDDGQVNQSEMVSGLWVGKFETTGDATTPTVLPNTASLVSQNVSAQFATSLKFAGGVMNISTGEVTFSGNDVYGLTSDTDSHMMKNSEWGAVAYLSHSQYGINEEVRINNYYNSGSLTGCGALTENEAQSTTCGIRYGTISKEDNTYPQSTTGNITGIFDMSGGQFEYVMGNYGTDVGGSGFSLLPESKYYNLYSSNIFTGLYQTNITLCTLQTCGGHALNETMNWYTDYSNFIDSDYSWVGRGGRYNDVSYAGIFASSHGNGGASSNCGYRSVLIPNEKIIVNLDANGGSINIIDSITLLSVSSTQYTTSGSYEYVVPSTNLYQIELWGAQGGYSDTYSTHARGAYTSGVISLEKSNILSINVGGAGSQSRDETFNGGGGGGSAADASGYSGGGATDIRTGSSSLNARIMVAGGGGGTGYSVYNSAGEKSNAGGLIGYSGGYYSGHTYDNQNGKGGTQISGGAAGNNIYSATGTVYAGTFGLGGNNSSISSEIGAGGGGGGYYGGGGGGGTQNGGSGNGGGGGSSYISGHAGCIAITSENDTTPKTTSYSSISDSYHYSGKKFVNTVMIDGSGYKWTTEKGSLQQMPNPSGGYYDSGVGHSGDGAARITKLSPIKKVMYHNEYGDLPSVTRYGYKFLGWYTDSSGGILVNSNNIVNNIKEHTLYAQWDPLPSYTVKFDANGGTDAPSSQIKYQTQDLSLTSVVPTKVGYTCIGWSTDKNATTAMYDIGDTFDVDANTTLYAVWKISTFTVSYNMNGGSGTIADQTKTYGVDLTLSDVTPTRTGHAFKGWALDSSDTTPVYDVGDIYTINADITLYAVWEQVRLYIFNAGGETNVSVGWSQSKDNYAQGSTSVGSTIFVQATRPSAAATSGIRYTMTSSVNASGYSKLYIEWGSCGWANPGDVRGNTYYEVKNNSTVLLSGTNSAPSGTSSFDVSGNIVLSFYARTNYYGLSGTYVTLNINRIWLE